MKKWLVIAVMAVALVGCTRDTEQVESLPLTFSISDTTLETGNNKVGWFFNQPVEYFYNKAMKVVATHERTDHSVVLLDDHEMVYHSPDNTANRTLVPSMINLPDVGRWKLDLYVDDVSYGHIMVDVEQYEGRTLPVAQLIWAEQYK
ncbi:hypothetical protein [Paenibacillus agilis]|uniref:DUF4871 domain-containing protein n=1 Tax=Paenibacillus agilis TaxID=3020863 RepID=A0A559J211_9BACL|nr:hypothetical protein [Paenibacillus agilis]TVX93883.1 hypothetical protein FPZ44_12960 [Paenibacillus agilis]